MHWFVTKTSSFFFNLLNPYVKRKKNNNYNNIQVQANHAVELLKFSPSRVVFQLGGTMEVEDAGGKEKSPSYRAVNTK